nr:hypothetical protein [Escherichia coli]
IRRASVASGAECRIVTRHLSFSGDVCLDHDRRDDHEELSYGGAAVAAVRVGYSAAIFLIPICISFDTAEKRRYATYLILNRRFSFEF